MTNVEQTGLFGTAIQVIEQQQTPRSDTVTWLKTSQFDIRHKDRALRLMGIEPVEGEPPLRTWRNAMMERTGLTEAEFRRWLDYEVNVYGNRSLAGFIWAMA